ncbi:putative toxin-antitoxin system toxin component, PIN family [Pseudanabaena sp. FACHB-1998]|uniref:putative toxin-antitoxin system toxin component, PIN family n=1 Tax=Pseudanabaena sp. FACHB-1998 TaxID=2692858 RepID=UPI0016816C65|nr:putative toxin-antitoxin system toxin component, PIN family [Pseudanabaena sp. FACHB-1998]MBD2175524.1 putative toxin-antitoxin system toxin component, PIN family [Pseudanabaena sp. FACHB-1998]
MRLVLDVNVWISGLLWQGVPRQIIDLARSGAVNIITSEPILSELEEVLARTKFKSKMRSLGITSQDLIYLVRHLCEVCVPILVDVPNLRDPDDAVILRTAIAAKALLVVSGDLDLLVLEEFAGIPILTPADFLDVFCLSTSSGKEI